MPSKPVEATSRAETQQEVDRIRDIIFGTQMRDYEGRFETVQRDLQRLQQEIDRLTEQVADQDASQENKLRNLRRVMRKADDDLREELRDTAHKLVTDKVDRVALGELFIELGTHLKAGDSPAVLLENLVKLEQDLPDDGE